MNEAGYPGLVVHGTPVVVMLLGLVHRNTVRRVAKFSFRGRIPLLDLHAIREVPTPGDDGIDLLTQGPNAETTMMARAELVREDCA